MRRVPRAAMAWCAAFAALLITHYQLLNLPFYWDELGQFVPAALDIYHRLAWVPYTTVPNVHPPLVMSYLALFWKVAGYSVGNTRAAMLLLAACALVAQWRLTRTLTGESAAAWLSVLFLFCNPLFFAQAGMAQLDMPAMLLATVALILFLEERFVLCAIACCAAVMAKETTVVAPALFGFLLLRRRRVDTALLFTIPLVPLLVWLAVLRNATGHWFGNASFTEYNVYYPLNPVRLGLALLRRGYYLLIGSGNIIGALAVGVWLHRRRWRPAGPWRIASAFVGLHVIVITVLGGAVLERYLLPALPVLYAAFGAAIWSLTRRVRSFAALGLALGLIVACVVNPPYPFPLENNLAWTTFVTLDQQIAQYAEAALPDATIATSFPLAGALRRPEMGYVSRPLHVLEINDFRESNLTGPVKEHADALIQYSILWDPMGILRRPWCVGVLERFYGYVPQAMPEDVPRLTGMQSAFRLCGAGQCVEVFRKTPPREPRPNAIPPSTQGE
jgi:4-amino-4-deoxy-L-arabinose transferase-like glycosyltransferase